MDPQTVSRAYQSPYNDDSLYLVRGYRGAGVERRWRFYAYSNDPAHVYACQDGLEVPSVGMMGCIGTEDYDRAMECTESDVDLSPAMLHRVFARAARIIIAKSFPDVSYVRPATPDQNFLLGSFRPFTKKKFDL